MLKPILLLKIRHLIFSKKNLAIPLVLSFFITGCNNTKTLELASENNITEKQSSLQMRDIQTKNFDNTTKENLSNAIINTLLDDGYFITFIDVNSGLISAKSRKDGVELSLVSVINEFSKNSYSVRFSINAVDIRLNSYTIVDDNLIYNQLFDKVKKSLFLEKNPHIKPKNVEIKESKKIENIPNEHKIEEKSISNFPIIEEKKQKTVAKESGKYTLQFVSAKDKKTAIEDYNKLKNKGYDVRLESLKNYYVVRLGNFEKPNEGYELLNKLKKDFPKVLLLKL